MGVVPVVALRVGVASRMEAIPKILAIDRCIILLFKKNCFMIIYILFENKQLIIY